MEENIKNRKRESGDRSQKRNEKGSTRNKEGD
jgi:hypothetical protein